MFTIKFLITMSFLNRGQQTSDLQAYLLQIDERQKKMEDNTAAILCEFDRMEHQTEIMVIQLEKLRILKDQYFHILKQNQLMPSYRASDEIHKEQSFVKTSTMWNAGENFYGTNLSGLGLERYTSDVSDSYRNKISSTPKHTLASMDDEVFLNLPNVSKIDANRSNHNEAPVTNDQLHAVSEHLYQFSNETQFVDHNSSGQAPHISLMQEKSTSPKQILDGTLNETTAIRSMPHESFLHVYEDRTLNINASRDNVMKTNLHGIPPAQDSYVAQNFGTEEVQELQDSRNGSVKEHSSAANNVKARTVSIKSLSEECMGTHTEAVKESLDSGNVSAYRSPMNENSNKVLNPAVAVTKDVASVDDSIASVGAKEVYKLQKETHELKQSEQLSKLQSSESQDFKAVPASHKQLQESSSILPEQELCPSPSDENIALSSSKNTLLSDSEFSDNNEVPLTSSIAYQNLIGAVPIVKEHQQDISTESESDDDVEKAVEATGEPTETKVEKKMIAENNNQFMSPSKKVLATNPSMNQSRKSLTTSTGYDKQKLSKATRKALGLDSDSDEALQCKATSVAGEEEDDEFDFFN